LNIVPPLLDEPPPDELPEVEPDPLDELPPDDDPLDELPLPEDPPLPDELLPDEDPLPLEAPLEDPPEEPPSSPEKFGCEPEQPAGNSSDTAAVISDETIHTERRTSMTSSRALRPKQGNAPAHLPLDPGSIKSHTHRIIGNY
jgi:hypothetical protein